MVTREDIEVLQNHLDERYVLQSDCNDTVMLTNKRIDDIRVDFAKIETRLNAIIGICAVIAVPIVSVAVKLLFG